MCVCMYVCMDGKGVDVFDPFILADFVNLLLIVRYTHSFRAINITPIKLFGVDESFPKLYRSTCYMFILLDFFFYYK